MKKAEIIDEILKIEGEILPTFDRLSIKGVSSYCQRSTKQDDDEMLKTLSWLEELKAAVKEVKVARSLVTEDKWAYYDLIHAEGLAEQIILNNAEIRLRKKWSERYDKTSVPKNH